MSLHPDLEAFLELVNTQPKQLYQNSIDEYRESYNVSSEFLDEYDSREAEVIEIAARDDYSIPVKHYKPREENSDRVIVFFHGGGYVLGNLDSHNTLCHRLVDHCKCQLFAVDYRLAPEHKFPTAFNDAWDAYSHIVESIMSASRGSIHITVMGDSVGATLATNVCIEAKNKIEKEICSSWMMPSKQVLLYPCTSAYQDTESFRKYSKGYLLEAEPLQWMYSQYLLSDQERNDRRFAPLKQGDLSGLSAAFIILPEFDPLIDEGKMYAKKLSEAGVSVETKVFEGMVHDFARFGNLVPNVVDELMTDISQFLSVE